MKEKYSFLTKNVFFFAISGVLPKILAFLIVPIYTGYLSSYEYGVYDLIHLTVELLVPIFALRIHDAVIRYSLDKEENPKNVLSVGFKITWVGAALVGIGTIVVMVVSNIDKLYLLAFYLYYVVNANTNLITRFCRTINKASIITVSTIANSVVMYSATLVFLLVFNWGINGFLFANILGYFSNICVCFFGAKLYQYITFETPQYLTSKMIKFSFPLIFGALAWWVNNASDRYIVSWICGVSASGIYALSYKIPSLLAVVQEVFQQAWSVSAIKEFDGEDKDGFISNINSLLQFGMGATASFLMLLNIPISRVMFSGEFFAAWKFVPPLLVSLVFNAMSLFVDGLLMAINKTKRIALFTLIGALVNTVANIVLIYLLGIYGAALATLLGFASAYVLRVFYSRRYIKIKRKPIRECLLLFILTIQILLSWLGNNMYIYQTVALFAIVMLYIKDVMHLLRLLIEKRKHRHKVG